jgi:hypothetical protein
MPWPQGCQCTPALLSEHLRSAIIGALGGMTLLGAVLYAGSTVRHRDVVDSAPTAPSHEVTAAPRETASPLQAAEAEVARAWAALRDIRIEQEQLLSRPEVTALSRAEQVLTQAEARSAQASAEVQRLRQPDRVQLEAAERSLWRAEATLRAAQSLRLVQDLTFSSADQAEEIRQAELAVREAREKREAALVGPPVEALAAAQVELASAEAAQHEAAERVRQLRQLVVTLPLEPVKAATASAISDLANAEARLRSVQLQQARQTQASYHR